MQDQIARQQGVIEVLQNDIARMKQESLERYQDLIDALERAVHLPRLLIILLPVVMQVPPVPLPGLPRKLQRQAVNRAIRRRKSCITKQPST